MNLNQNPIIPMLAVGITLAVIIALGILSDARLNSFPAPILNALAEFDFNQDTRITRTEFEKANRLQFNALDLNRDEIVTRQEVRAFYGFR